MPKAALSMRMVQSEHSEWRDALSQDWIEYVNAQGVTPVAVPNDPGHCTQYLDGVDLLILTGGDNVNIKPNEQSAMPQARRDQTEYALLTAAIEKNIPVLGVCHGMQLINVYFGGTIKPLGLKEHVATEHTVTIKNSDLFEEEVIIVNSYHNDGIETLGKDLHVWAKAGDVIEGVKHNSLPITGLMWHPERTFEDPYSRKMHRNLISRLLHS